MAFTLSPIILDADDTSRSCFKHYKLLSKINMATSLNRSNSCLTIVIGDADYDIMLEHNDYQILSKLGIVSAPNEYASFLWCDPFYYIVEYNSRTHCINCHTYLGIEPEKIDVSFGLRKMYNGAYILGCRDVTIVANGNICRFDALNDFVAKNCYPGDKLYELSQIYRGHKHVYIIAKILKSASFQLYNILIELDGTVPVAFHYLSESACKIKAVGKYVCIVTTTTINVFKHSLHNCIYSNECRIDIFNIIGDLLVYSHVYENQISVVNMKTRRMYRVNLSYVKPPHTIREFVGDKNWHIEVHCLYGRTLRIHVPQAMLNNMIRNELAEHIEI